MLVKEKVVEDVVVKKSETGDFEKRGERRAWAAITKEESRRSTRQAPPARLAHYDSQFNHMIFQIFKIYFVGFFFWSKFILELTVRFLSIHVKAPVLTAAVGWSALPLSFCQFSLNK